MGIIDSTGGTRMSKARYLHAQAERCFRLASHSAGLRIADELEALGRTFEQEARENEDVIGGTVLGEPRTSVLRYPDLEE